MTNMDLVRMCVLLGSLKAECLGMRRSHGRSAYSIVKREFGLKGSKERVLIQFERIVQRAKDEFDQAKGGAK